MPGARGARGRREKLDPCRWCPVGAPHWCPPTGAPVGCPGPAKGRREKLDLELEPSGMMQTEIHRLTVRVRPALQSPLSQAPFPINGVRGPKSRLLWPAEKLFKSCFVVVFCCLVLFRNVCCDSALVLSCANFSGGHDGWQPPTSTKQSAAAALAAWETRVYKSCLKVV